MRYDVVKFRMEHFENFKPRAVQLPEIQFLKEHPTLQQAWVFEMPIFTLLADGVPVMIYGIQNAGAGTYFPMIYAAEGLDKHIFHVVRCIYQYVDTFVGEDVRRFEAYVAATDEKANRLVKFFGFYPIGFRTQAGYDGGDQVIYERLWRK